jgi:hypothetical protein
MWPEIPDHPGPDRFFLDAVGSAENLRQEIFHLAYRLHWSYEDAMGLEIDERRAFVRLLIEMLERENEAVRRASAKPSA